VTRTLQPRPIACPAAFLGDFHHAIYDISSGIWKCRHCGLGGNVRGFARLNDLESERYGLQIELDIARFENELANRKTQPVSSSHE